MAEEGQGEAEKLFQESLEERPEEIKQLHSCDAMGARPGQVLPALSSCYHLCLDVGAESPCS